MKKLLILFALLLMFSGCQMVTRQFGGKTQIQLEPHERFINVTWKDSDIWVLVEDTQANAYVFKEYSAMGVFQGSVIIKKAEQ